VKGGLHLDRDKKVGHKTEGDGGQFPWTYVPQGVKGTKHKHSYRKSPKLMLKRNRYDEFTQRKLMHVLAIPCVHVSNIFCITALTDRTPLGLSRGCYKDLPVRAMEILEGKDHLLDGNYSTRKNAAEKCVLVGRGLGYPIVGIQDGGMCVGSPTRRDFNKYGISRDCRSDGRGGPWATEVYALESKEGR